MNQDFIYTSEAVAYTHRPAPESVAKVQDYDREVLYLKSGEEQELIRMRELLERYIEINRGFASVHIQFDFNA